MAELKASKQQVETILDDMAKSANRRANEIRDKHAKAAAAEVDAYFRQVVSQMQRTANQYGYESLGGMTASGSVGRGYTSEVTSGQTGPFGKARVRPLK